jgi:hypothetical protein
MIIRRYTPSGKWSKPLTQGAMSRLGGSVHPSSGERINCTMRNDQGFIVTVGRGEYELLKHWFEGEDKKQ